MRVLSLMRTCQFHALCSMLFHSTLMVTSYLHPTVNRTLDIDLGAIIIIQVWRKHHIGGVDHGQQADSQPQHSLYGVLTLRRDFLWVSGTKRGWLSTGTMVFLYFSVGNTYLLSQNVSNTLPRRALVIATHTHKPSARTAHHLVAAILIHHYIEKKNEHTSTHTRTLL